MSSESPASSISSSLICNVCNRSFSRPEHRDRHMATHNAIRPYSCNFCSRQFQRTDTLRRHVDKHCPNNIHGARALSESRSRVKTACDACHSKKLRCDGQEPCKKCASKNQPCTYRRSVRLGLPDSPELNLPDRQGSRLLEADRSTSGPSSSERTPSEQNAVIHTPNTDHQSQQPQQSLDATSVPRGQSSLSPWPSQRLVPLDPQSATSPDVDMMTASDFSSLDSTSHVNNSQLLDSMAGIGSNFFQEIEAEFFGVDPSMLSSPNYIGHPETELSHLLNVLDLESAGTQFDDQAARWLQTPLIPRRYDIAVLNALLEVFLKRVAGTFTSYQGFKITSQTLPEQIIAMAAVGSLFANVKGSSRVARMLFTDANRMISNFLGGFQKYPKPVALSLVQAFLAAELFGLCGGHPRSRELSEAFHGALVQCINRHELFTPEKMSDPDDQSRRERLLADIFLLEAYRTTLFQLKPLLTPAFFVSQISQGGHGRGREAGNWVTDMLHQQTQLTKGLVYSEQLDFPLQRDIYRVALISISSWHAGGRWLGNMYEAVDRQWEPHLIHNSVEACLHILCEKDEVSSTLFAHMIVVSLHAPLAAVNEAAFAATTRKPPGEVAAEGLRNWRRSFDVDRALEHASLMLDAAAGIVTPEGTTPGYVEGPHDALCVFNAVLVIWASKRTEAVPSGSGEAAMIPELARGAAILMRFHLSAARMLSQVLLAIHKAVSLGQA